MSVAAPAGEWADGARTRASAPHLLLLSEGAQVVHYAPHVVVFGATGVFGGHVALAFASDVEPCAIGRILLNIWIGEVGDVLDVGSHVAFAVTLIAVAEGAINHIELFAPGERLGGGLDRVRLAGVFGWNLVGGRLRLLGSEGSSKNQRGEDYQRGAMGPKLVFHGIQHGTSSSCTGHGSGCYRGFYGYAGV